MLITNTNAAKDAMKKGKKVLASWLQAASNINAEIIGLAGFDVAIIDMEHGPSDLVGLISQIQALKGLPAVPFVRAPWNDLVIIKRILDAGAFGLIIPYVNSAKEVSDALSAALYPAKGKDGIFGMRGIAGSVRAAGFGLKRDYLTEINNEVCIFTQVETPQAVADLDAMLKIERVDGIFIGPMDLSTSMGHFGNPGHEEVQKVILDCEKRILAAGKLLATVANNWEDAAVKYKRGYHMVVPMSDTTGLGTAAKNLVDAFKKEYA